MSSELVRQVQAVLADAGFGPDSGLTAQSDGAAVIVAWHPDRLIRPTIAAHATDPEVHAAAAITGIRTALETALTSVFLSAGLVPLPQPDGFIRVTATPTG
ncbi:hypothetical protein [Streptomyces sp. CC208A]|uniref:hypothetical protein n=1 Tax=Streptomyces sp. CC208A TaxID=3044573 RepID=UPI0024A978B5|nr:hypothetical protein [Streptomyces sp. CC208A]